jgi:proline iminopeptidase
VQAARRFYNGQVTPGDYFPTIMKFIKAYYYHSNLLGTAHEAIFGPRIKFRPETNIFCYRELLNGWTVMDRLGEIKVPTLVMGGRDDFLFPPEHQVALAAGIPGARLEIIECAGHNPQSEQPAQVIGAIRDFMATTRVVAT